MAKYVIMAAYILLIAVIAVWSTKKINGMSAFLLGGRAAGAWMSAFAYGTTYFSAVLFIGYAGRNGWTFGLWAVLIGIGNAILGTWLAWSLLAKRTRDMTHRLKLSTMPEYFNARYQSKGMKTFAAVIIFIFMTPYSASVYSGLSYLFEGVFGIDYIWAIIIMAALSALYLVLGGYVATLVADLVQGIIMLGGVILMVGVMTGHSSIGGLVASVTKLSDLTGDNVKLFDFSSPSNLINLLSLVLLTSVGTWGLPQMIHKFYAIKDEKAIRKGTVISTLFSLIIGAGAYFTGGIARLYNTINNIAPPEKVSAAGVASIDYDRIIPDFLTSTLPDALLGVIIILVLSASVTTLTGIVLVSSSSLTMDLIKEKFAKSMSQKSELLTTRILCLVFVVISVIVALTKSPIQTLMAFSWGTVSGCFLAPYALGLYWKGVTKAGAWAGMGGGAAVSVILALINNFNTAQAPLYGVIAMASSFVLTVAVSLFTKKYDEAHIKHVFEGSCAEADR